MKMLEGCFDSMSYGEWKMSEDKDSEFSFELDAKESFKQRLRELIGPRSVRSVARSWGLSFSTLNNYLNRGTDPSLSAVKAIAKAEGVSIDWLASGENHNQSNSIEIKSIDELHINSPNDKLSYAWLMVLESIEPSEALGLIKLIHRKGIERVISEQLEAASDSQLSSLERELLKLPKEEKERLMALHEAKKGASEGSEVGNTVSPASDQKQAS